MTAPATADITLRVQEPLDHQWGPILSPASRKLWRFGRRWGKTRGVFYVAQMGHGPIDEDGQHMHPGIISGMDVVWVVPEYPQARTIWREEIRPRFKRRRGFYLNEQLRCLTMEATGGTLYVVSGEAIDSVRGIGDRLAGVIVDEAAHQDLEYSMKAVLQPALMDNEGWLIAVSTTNAGQDGNQEKRTPSFFNVLCEQVRAGERDGRWEEFHGDARDNPVITDQAFDDLVGEYAEGSVDLDQEVYAKLLETGAGLAFPEWDDKLHLTTFCPERDRRGHWRWAAGGDWGYASPGWFGLVAGGEDGRMVVRKELYFQESDPYTVGTTFARMCDALALPEYLVLDSACWQVTDGGKTIAARIQEGIKKVLGDRAFPVVQAPKGPGSRPAGKLLVHEALKAKRAADGTVPPWGMPRLQVVGEDCPNLVRTLPKLPRDERNPEDVDTKREDHPYDGLRYLLMAGVPGVTVEQDREATPGRHKGYRKDGTRRSEVPTFEDEMEQVEGGGRGRGRSLARARRLARLGALEDYDTGDDS